MLTSFFSNFVVEFYVDFDIPTDETQSYLIFEKNLNIECKRLGVLNNGIA